MRPRSDVVGRREVKKPSCASNANPRLLSAEEASRTLVARLAPTVDRLRQRLTTFGVRPYQVFLVWTRWTGPERGEGSERILKRTAILPSPQVEDLTGISLQFFSGGVIPVGSVRVTGISALYAQDVLMGLTVPPDPEAKRAAFVAGKKVPNPETDSLAAEEVLDPYEFFWEIVEDGRSNQGRPARRARFRPLSAPFRRADQFDWGILLERVDDDMNRSGQPRTATASPVGACDEDD